MGGPGGFACHTGALHDHAKTVHVVAEEFGTGVLAMAEEVLTTPLAFGVLWEPYTTPPLISFAVTTGQTAYKASQALRGVGTTIERSAELYDKCDTHTAVLVKQAAPDVEGPVEVMTNVFDIPDAAYFNDVKSLIEGIVQLAGSGSFSEALDNLLDVGAPAFDILLDAVGFMIDPLGTFLGGLIGLAIDLNPILKQLLDVTLGDPQAIGRISEGFENVARYFVDTADHLQESAQDVVPRVWDGDAARGYLRTVEGAVQQIGSLGGACHMASDQTLVMGSIVGDTRAYLIGKLTGYLAEQLILACAAAAAAAPTAGISVAGFLEEFAVTSAIEVAELVISIIQAVLHLIECAAKIDAADRAFAQYSAKLAT